MPLAFRELGLHPEPHEFCVHVGIRWWLAVDISRGLPCPLCPNTALDPLGHQAVTCKKLREVEVGSTLTPDRSDPAQLMFWFMIGLLADLLLLISLCHHPSLNKACTTSGSTAQAAEARKHRANDPKCSEIGWVCVSLAVETYGNWGKEARDTFSRLAPSLLLAHPNLRAALSSKYSVNLTSP